MAAKFVEEWTLPPSATLGSSVRAKGILLEARAHLSSAAKKLLGIDGGVLSLGMPEGAEDDFRTASTIVSNTLEGIENLPIGGSRTAVYKALGRVRLNFVGARGR